MMIALGLLAWLVFGFFFYLLFINLFGFWDGGK